jgi:Outer membrane protein beta-barrel domain
MECGTRRSARSGLRQFATGALPLTRLADSAVGARFLRSQPTPQAKGEVTLMKHRTLWFAAAALFLLASISTKAQGRLELTPFVGYETSGSYPINNSTLFDNLRVNSSVAFGTFIDYNVTENFQGEFMWNRNNTSFSGHNILTQTYYNLYHSDVDQYQFGGLYMLRGSEHRLRPYIAASVGFTHNFNSNGTANNTAFSYSIGGGVKYYVSRHLGFRGDIRYLPTYGNTGVQCDYYYGCYNVRNYLNRASLTGGIVLHF